MRAARDFAKQASSAPETQRMRADLTGNLSLTPGNMVNGRNLVVRLTSDPRTRTLSFPSGWRWIGSAAPANIAANKIAMLWLWCFSGSEADVMARCLVEP